MLEADRAEVVWREQVAAGRAVAFDEQRAEDRAEEARRVAAGVEQLRAAAAAGDGVAVLVAAGALVGAKVRELAEVALDDVSLVVTTVDGSAVATGRATGWLLASTNRKAALMWPATAPPPGGGPIRQVWAAEGVIVARLEDLAGRFDQARADGDEDTVVELRASHGRLRRLLGRRALGVAPLDVDQDVVDEGLVAGRRAAVGYPSGWAS